MQATSKLEASEAVIAALRVHHCAHGRTTREQSRLVGEGLQGCERKWGGAALLSCKKFCVKYHGRRLSRRASRCFCQHLLRL